MAAFYLAADVAATAARRGGIMGMAQIAWAVAGGLVTLAVAVALVFWCVQEERDRRAPPPPPDASE